MRAKATTTLTVYRGTTTNDYEDEVDANTEDTEVATGVVASLIEQNRRVFPQTGDFRNQTTIIHYVTGRVSSGEDIRNNDRVKDERTGRIYLVEGVRQPQSPVGKTDLTFEAKILN